MADATNEPSDSTPAPGGGAFEQSDIDSLFDGATARSEDGADSSEQPESAPAGDVSGDGDQPVQGGAVSQADIDALLSSGTRDGESGGPSAEGGVAEEDLNQPVESDARLDTLGRPFDEAAAAMQAALEEEGGAAPFSQVSPSPAATAGSSSVVSQSEVSATPFVLSELGGGGQIDVDAKRVTMLNDVKLRVKIELGRTRMLVEDVLQLDEGSVVELDKLAGDPVDVRVNDRLIARGEVLVLNDNFCVRISEVFSADPHRVSV